VPAASFLPGREPAVINPNPYPIALEAGPASLSRVFDPLVAAEEAPVEALASRLVSVPFAIYPYPAAEPTRK